MGTAHHPLARLTGIRQIRHDMRILALAFLFICAAAAAEETEYQPEFSIHGGRGPKAPKQHKIQVFYQKPDQPYDVIDIVVVVPGIVRGTDKLLKQAVLKRGGDAAYVISKNPVSDGRGEIKLYVTAQVIKFKQIAAQSKPTQTELSRYGRWSVQRFQVDPTRPAQFLALTSTGNDSGTERGLGVTCDSGSLRIAIHWGIALAVAPPVVDVRIDNGVTDSYPYSSLEASPTGSIGYASSNARFSALINAMKNGNVIRVALKPKNRGSIEAVFSLNGFSNAYAELVRNCQNM